MNVEGQYNPKDVECIPVENLEVLPSGADWQSRHLESERRKAEIRDRIHKQAEQGQKTAKDYFRPAKPTPSIYDSDLKRVAVYARVSTSSEEQISSIENQTLYYTKKIAETENWNLQDIYSDEGKSGTSLRKRDAFKRMMRDAKDQKMDLIICARCCWKQMVWQKEKTISLKDGMMPRKMQLSFRLKKMNKVPSRLKSVQLDITSTWAYNTSKWT